MPGTSHFQSVAAICFVTGLLLPLRLAAQGEDVQTNAPITVEANPGSIPAGSSVTLSGTTVAHDTTGPVRLTVTWLGKSAGGSGSARSERLTAASTDKGAFSVKFSPKRVGKYRVVAESPDGSGADSSSFTVLSMKSWVDEQVKTEEQFLDLSSELMDAITEYVARQPVSPPQQELEKKRLPKLRAALAKRKEAVAQMRGILEIHTEIAFDIPGAAPVYEPMNEEIAKFKEEADRLTPEAKRAIASTRRGAADCDELMVMEDGIKLASAMLNVVQNMANSVFGFATDIALGWATGKAPSWCGGTCQTAFTEVVKTHVGLDIKELMAKEGKATKLAELKEHYMGSVAGLVTDAVGFVTQQLIGAYCERFEGPVTAGMRAEFTEHGEPWWKYTEFLEGKLILNYRKGGNIKKGVAVSGVLVGTATGFRVWENALRVKFPNKMKYAIAIGTTLPPAGTPFVDVAGITAIQPLPTAFLIPVEGSLVGKKLTLSLKKATNDVDSDYAQARGAYRFFSPFMLGSAYTAFELPYEKAEFIFQKATGADKKPFTMEVVVTGKKMKADKEFHGASGTARAKGTYQAKITVCNPKC